jgi:hypothetical protein
MIRGFQIAYFMTRFWAGIRVKNGAFPPLHRGGRRENFADSAVDATFVPLIGGFDPARGWQTCRLTRRGPAHHPMRVRVRIFE